MVHQLALLISSYLALVGHQQQQQQLDESAITNVGPAEWDSFKMQHGKWYKSDLIELRRKLIYGQNKQIIEQFQKEPRGFSLKLNHLADWTNAERSQLNGLRLPEDVEARRKALMNTLNGEKFLQHILNDTSIDVPDHVDWRQVAGRVTAVKDQGECGSCWAFSSTGSLEGQERPQLNKSELVDLSVQQLVDCVYPGKGCGGGFMSDAFNYIVRSQGIDSEQSYPYRARDGTCRFKKAQVAISDRGSAILPKGDEQKLKEVVAKFGPVSVLIDSSGHDFQFYENGVYFNKDCKTAVEDMDHAVLVAGYGVDPIGGDYWLVKNSWGEGWGDEGYIWMARNRDNHCGIATMATIPTF